MRTQAPRSAPPRDFVPAARRTAQKSNRKPRLQEHCVNSAPELEPVRVHLPARRPEARGFPLPWRENVSVRTVSRVELPVPSFNLAQVDGLNDVAREKQLDSPIHKNSYFAL